MVGETGPTPIENFHEKDKVIVNRIDDVLAGYETALPNLSRMILEVDPIEIDRSPHPRHGVPNTVKSAGLVAVRGQLS